MNGQQISVAAQIGQIMTSIKERKCSTAEERQRIEELRRNCPHHLDPTRLVRGDGSCEECGEMLR